MTTRLPAALIDGLKLPVVAAPMLVASGPDLVVAQCAAGVVGSFPALNARPQSSLRDWLAEIGERLALVRAANPSQEVASYAVNQVVHKTNDRFEKDFEAITAAKVPIVITSLGARAEVFDEIHSYGGIALHDVVNDEFARKAVDRGADGIVAVAAGAGGHAGTTSPFALIQEIRSWYDGPLLLSGSIANGRSILAARAAGADLAYIGSAFLSTTEANVDPAYRKMVIESRSKDIVYTDLFTGVHANFLRPSIEAAGFDSYSLAAGDSSTMNFGSDGTTAVKVWRDLWSAGHGIGSVTREQSVWTLVDRWAEEYRDARSRLLRDLPDPSQGV